MLTRTALLGPWRLLLIAGFLPICSFAQAAAQNLDENRARCRKSFADPDLAIPACSAIIQSGTGTRENLAGALRDRALAYRRKGEYDRAFEDYDQLVRLTPDDLEVLFKRAEAYLERARNYDIKEDYDRAIQDYDQALRLHPNDMSALKSRAFAYQEKGDDDRAIEDFTQLRIKSPDAYEAFYRSFAYELKKDYDRAIQDYDQVIQLHPNSRLAAYALMLRAAAYQKKGDYDRAIQDRNQAIHMDPSLADANPAHNFGRAGANWERCWRTDIPDVAIVACTAIIESGSENDEDLAQIFDNRAEAYANKDDYDRAFLDFDQALRLKPGFSRVLFDRALVYEKKGDYDHAIQDFDEGIRLYPRESDYFLDRGRAYRQKGDYRRSLQDYDQAIQLTQTNFIGNSIAFRGRAWVRFVMGQFLAASEDFRKAAELYGVKGYVIDAYLGQRRAGKPGESDLQNRAAKLNLDKWPGAVIRLYLGSMTQDEVLSAANNSNAKVDRRQHCEAYFYLGEYELLRNRHVKAGALFQKAIATGAEIAKSELPRYDEPCYAGAQAELKRLPKPDQVKNRRIAR